MLLVCKMIPETDISIASDVKAGERGPSASVAEKARRRVRQRVKSHPSSLQCSELLFKWKKVRQVIDRADKLCFDLAGDELSPHPWIRHLTDEKRHLQTALRETGDFLRSASRASDGGYRVYEVAEAFLISTGLVFDIDELRRYCSAIQEIRFFTLAELEGLRPTLQLLLLEHIASTLSKLLGEGGQNDQASLQSADLLRQFSNLRAIGAVAWDEVTEDLSLTHRVLCLDPQSVYTQMDFDGRQMYRKAVQEIAARSHNDELTIVQDALTLAREASRDSTGPRVRRSHIGFFLMDDGRIELEKRCAYRPRALTRFTRSVSRFPTLFYVGSVAFSMTLEIAVLVIHMRPIVCVVPAILLLLLPVSECAVQITDQLIALLFPPRSVPKCDYSMGIPAECSTMVAIPVILEETRQIEQLARDLEVRYLGNRDPNLHFALLTDLPDSIEPMDDNHPLVSLCSRLVRDLDDKYANRGAGRFFHFHRRQIYDPSQSKWTGWERKRGKLLEFNAMLRGDCSAFPVQIGELSVLPRIRYVITLDADTKLPLNCAHRMVGAIAHPLNRAVIDPTTNTVKEGYGILQPHIAVCSKSASCSLFSRLFAGTTGFDIYTNAISNAYYDLCGEGTFAGKGIYDVDVACRVLSEICPPHLVLSHDLLEGAFARTGLLSDLELIEDYPATFNAFLSRKHRWIRGDWQTAFWMLPRVPNGRRTWADNHLSPISRWKILDNLRRSLLEPSLVLLLFVGWFLLPRGADYWTNAVAGIMLLPPGARFLVFVIRSGHLNLSGALRKSTLRLKQDLIRSLVELALCAATSIVAMDAIGRALWRMCISRRNLLEWRTFSQMETRTQGSLSLATAQIFSVVCGAACACQLWVNQDLRGSTETILLLSMWVCAPALCKWLNAPIVRKAYRISGSNEEMLRELALRIWLFFQTFGGERAKWLIPDNVWLEPPDASTRTSPTNIGLLLNARIAAYELGFITLQEFVSSTQATLATLMQLQRYRGHWFNWYDINSLEPESPRFVSTADSGNLAASLLTLKQCCAIAIEQPQNPDVLWVGLLDHVRLVLVCASIHRKRTASLHLRALQRFLSEGEKRPSWQRLPALQESLIRLLNDRDPSSGADTARDVTWAASEALARISKLTGRAHADSGLKTGTETDLPDKMCAADTQSYAEILSQIVGQIDRLLQEMDFEFLYRQRHRALSVGYDADRMRHHGSCYDLLASESRTALFIAIAKGDLPSKAWFALGRPHARLRNRTVLVSWAGTMFEYLMPNLWMKLYPESLLERGVQAAVRAQANLFEESRNPWGLSESASSSRDLDGSYGYVAFGITELSLRPQRILPAVISPYSSFLALLADVRRAILNIRLMKKMNWVGQFGFYEAVKIQFSDRSNVSDNIIGCWMAHHQGMGLLAICNVLTKCSIQHLFHREPMITAVDRLLEERFPIGTRVEKYQG